jgi:very-short-patch-repair endonuclease
MKRIKTSPEVLSERAEKMLHNPTYSESLMYELLKSRFKERIKRQKVFRPYIVDFYLSDRCLVIEVDGEIHKKQKAYDQRRDKILEKRYRLKVLRIEAKDLYLPEQEEEIIRKIKEGIENARGYVRERVQRDRKLAQKRIKAKTKRLNKKLGISEARQKQIDKKLQIPVKVVEPELQEKLLALEARQKEEQAKAEREKAERLKRLYSRTF